MKGFAILAVVGVVEGANGDVETSVTKAMNQAIFRSRFGSRAIPVQPCAVFLQFHELIWFCLVLSVYNPVLQFAPVLMTNDDDGSEVHISPVPGSSSKSGSPNGSGSNLQGRGRSNDAQFREVRDILLPAARRFADFDNHVKAISETVGAVAARNYQC